MQEIKSAIKMYLKNQSTQFICLISSCFYMHVKHLWLVFLSHLTEESIEGLLLVRRLLMLMCGSTKCWPAQVVLRGKPLFLVPWRMWVADRREIFRRGQISSVSWYPAARHPVRLPSGRRRPTEGRRCHFAAALQKQQALCCFWKSEAAILTHMIYLHNISLGPLSCSFIQSAGSTTGPTGFMFWNLFIPVPTSSFSCH